MTCTQDMCHATHVLFCAPERVLEPYKSRSCARQHWTQITTCDQTDRKNLSTHLDLCVSSVTQKISQNRLRLVTPLRLCTLLAVQAFGDLAFNSGRDDRSHHKRCPIHGGAARTRHDDAMQGKRLLPLQPRVCPLSVSGGATRTHRSHIESLSDVSRLQAHLRTALAIQYTRFTSRACTCRAASLLNDFIAASFIAALPFPTASFVDQLSRCYLPTSFIVFGQMNG